MLRLGALLGVVSIPVLGWSYAKPHPDFAPGDPIRSQDVNETIDDIYASLNDLDERLGRLSASEVISAPGPLPLSADFTSAGGSRMVLFVSGSGVRDDAAGSIPIDVSVDGDIIGTLSVRTNEVLSHKAVVSAALVIADLPAGDHTLTLEANPGDTAFADGNDSFHATVLELP